MPSRPAGILGILEQRELLQAKLDAFSTIPGGLPCLVGLWLCVWGVG